MKLTNKQIEKVKGLSFVEFYFTGNKPNKNNIQKIINWVVKK